MLTAHAARGLTLTEILIATSIAFVVVIGFAQMDVSQMRIREQLRAQGVLQVEQVRAGLAALRLAKDIEKADRVVIRTGGPSGDIHLRFFEPDTNAGPCVCAGAAVPPACCFDIVGNYQWDEYKRVGADFIFYSDTSGGCGTNRILASQITSFTAAFSDEAPAPPGGDPWNPNQDDNNTVIYAIRWDDGTTNQTFSGQSTSRAISYSDVGAAPNDSGQGLSPAGPGFDPPGMC